MSIRASLVTHTVKDVPASAGDACSTPGLGRSPGEGNGNPLQSPCLENPMDRGGQVDSLALRHQGSPGAQVSLLLIGMCPKGRGEGCFTWDFADSVFCKGSIIPSSLSYKPMLPQSSVEEVSIKY